jgi:SAM-dependent methyltransferase
MTQIEHRVETTATNPAYSERAFSAEEIAQGKHRSFIGGHWDTHGQHQVDFLVANGLKPEHTFLDVGCGCFRAGRFLVDLLEPGHYYGIDANLGLLQAGYEHEFTDEQRARVPVANLRANDRFNCDFGATFDMAIAQSVFTHVSLNHMRLCLYRVAQQIRPGGKFYVTFYEQGPNTPLDKLKPGGRHMFTERNPYWYYRSDLKWVARVAPWKFRYIGDWGHPNKQMMVEFTRLTDAEWAATKAPPAATPKASSFSASAKKLVRRGRRWAARHLDAP